MSSEGKIDRFVHWFRLESETLWGMPSVDAAELVSDRLLEIDNRLGIEVERSFSSPREMIFTAFSNPEVFELVRDLVRKIGSVSGWKLTALKPARGFNFSITIAGERVRATDILFRIVDEEGTQIQLTIPGVQPKGAGSDELAWLLVEGGLGEELASRITHIEFVSKSFDGTARPIAELEEQIRAFG